MYMKRTNIYLPAKTIQEVKARAEARGLTMSEYVRESIQRNMVREQPDTAFNNLLKMAENASKSKYTDLSKNHDKYLYGEERIA